MIGSAGMHDAGTPLEHDPEKWVPVFGKSLPSGLTRGIMLQQRPERDDDSKKSHHALGQERAVPASLYAAIMVLVASLPVAAAELPDNVRREVENARARCVSLGGSTGPIEAATFDYDVDGDGIKDWIVDPRKLNCQGSRRVFCDDECSFHLFLGQPDGTWRASMHIMVAGWDVGRTFSGKPALFLTQSGDACHPPRKKGTCRNTFVFERGSMIHVQPDPRGRR